MRNALLSDCPFAHAELFGLHSHHCIFPHATMRYLAKSLTFAPCHLAPTKPQALIGLRRLHLRYGRCVDHYTAVQIPHFALISGFGKQCRMHLPVGVALQYRKIQSPSQGRGYRLSLSIVALPCSAGLVLSLIHI